MGSTGPVPATQKLSPARQRDHSGTRIFTLQLAGDATPRVAVRERAATTTRGLSPRPPKGWARGAKVLPASEQAVMPFAPLSATRHSAGPPCRSASAHHQGAGGKPPCRGTLADSLLRLRGLRLRSPAWRLQSPACRRSLRYGGPSQSLAAHLRSAAPARARVRARGHRSPPSAASRRRGSARAVAVPRGGFAADRTSASAGPAPPAATHSLRTPVHCGGLFMPLAWSPSPADDLGRKEVLHGSTSRNPAESVGGLG